MIKRRHLTNAFYLQTLVIYWLVIDLPQNNQTILLKLNEDLKITNTNSFCIRFRLTGIKGYRSLFCTDEFEFCLLFEVKQQYGFVYLNLCQFSSTDTVLRQASWMRGWTGQSDEIKHCYREPSKIICISCLV